MSKKNRTLVERVWGTLGRRPTKGWTSSEIVDFLGDVNYSSVTALLTKYRNDGLVKKVAKRPSDVTNYSSFAYTRA